MFRRAGLLNPVKLPPLRREPASGPITLAIVRLKAKLRGTWGNGIAVSKSSAAITLSSSLTSGGADYPPGGYSIDTGKTVFPVAGDRWRGQQVNALRVIQDVTDAERGRFYGKDDGTLVWENRDRLFTSVIAAPKADLNAVFAQVQGGMEVEKVYNRIVVQYSPRVNLTSGVVAKANDVITIPPYGSGAPTPRYNQNDAFDDPKATVVRLPFIDPATGQKIGAKSLILPLAAGTDIYVTDTADGTGFNYTPSGAGSTLRVAVANSGENAEIQFINTAIGNLYVNKLQIRGVGIASYNPTEYIQEDTTAQTLNQVRSFTLALPLPAAINYVRALTQYLLARYKNALYRVQGLVFGDLEEGTIPGVTPNIFAFNQGDIVTVTDPQLGWSAVKHRIIGIQASVRAEKNMQVTFYLSRVDDKTFWVLGSSSYGKLGTNTRLAV